MMSNTTQQAASDSPLLVHRTVLLHEAVDALTAVYATGSDTRARIFVDGTFGRGGHSRLLLEKMAVGDRLLAFDKDPLAIASAQAITDTRFQIIHQGFATMLEACATMGIDGVDGLLLDLGVSSPQIDEPSRGFSFRFDAPLDMRMDTTRGITAAEWLAVASEVEIARVIKDYGEERFAKPLARAIVAARLVSPIATTKQLAALCAMVVRTREEGQSPATRTFQALRIFINGELSELETVLSAAMRLLKPQGRLVVISFHSLEDRIVKQFIRHHSQPDTLPSRLPLRAHELPKPRLLSIGKAIRPSLAEVSENPRARSAVMRIAEVPATA